MSIREYHKAEYHNMVQFSDITNAVYMYIFDHITTWKLSKNWTFPLGKKNNNYLLTQINILAILICFTELMLIKTVAK